MKFHTEIARWSGLPVTILYCSDVNIVYPYFSVLNDGCVLIVAGMSLFGCQIDSLNRMW